MPAWDESSAPTSKSGVRRLNGSGSDGCLRPSGRGWLAERRMGCGGFGSVMEAAAGSIEGGEMIGAAATPLDELLITEHIICAVTKRSLPNCSLTALRQAGTGPSRVAVGPVATDAMLAAYRQARGGRGEVEVV